MATCAVPAAEDWLHQAHVDLVGLWEDAAFRLYEAYDVIAGPRWRLELDAQPYGEVWLIREGACSVALGEQHVVVQPGQVALLRPGPRRVSANAGTQPLSLAGFGCGVMLFGAIDLLGLLKLPLVLPHPSDRLRDLITETVAASQADRTSRAFRAPALAGLALAEIVDLARADLRDGSGSGAPLPDVEVRPEVRAVLAHVALHFGDHLDLDNLARAAHLSPKHLARCFRETLGVTPMAYVRRYRLTRAREQLVTTDLPVSRIATDTGFADLAHFSRAFRTQFGVSPRILRTHTRALRSTSRSAGTSLPGGPDVVSTHN